MSPNISTHMLCISVIGSPLLMFSGFHFTLAKSKYMPIDHSDSCPGMTVATEQLERNGKDMT